MRTWRQGVIARVPLAGRAAFFLHCHTYPLARAYTRFVAPGSLEDPVGWLRVRLQDFAVLERVGERPLTAAERRLREDAPGQTSVSPHHRSTRRAVNVSHGEARAAAP